MPIVNSQITNQLFQVDGSSLVYETHTDHTGKTYDMSYTLGVGLDVQAVLAANALKLSERVDALMLSESVAANYQLPLSPYQFLNRFTPAERIAARTLAKTDPVVEDILFMVQNAQNVYLTDPATIQGVGYLQSVGVLTTERAGVILNG